MGANNLKVKLIYPRNTPSWVGLDTFECSLDKNLYSIMIEFLQGFFSREIPQFRSDNWCVSIDNALTKKKNMNFKRVQLTDDKDFNEVVDQRVFQEKDIPNFKVIPGGKYGCSQFIQMCGPKELQQTSLGRISRMVQTAIDEDYLRYSKTLLYWNDCPGEDPEQKQMYLAPSGLSNEQRLKLKVIKTLLISVLQSYEQMDVQLQMA